YYVPNNGRDPEVTDYGAFRFRIRGNGVWTYAPPPRRGIYKIDGANVITSLRIRAAFFRAGEADLNRVSVSTTNGLVWREVWRNEKTGATPIDLLLVDEVNGAYEVLVAVDLEGKASEDDARLDEIAFETTTMLNAKTQPKLLLGRNTVHVGAGEQTGSIVFWPDLRGDAWRPYAVDSRNVATQKEHPGYMGAMHAERPNEEAYVVFRIDAPHDIARVTYGGRLYNRAPKAHVDFLHSFDEGKTWTRTYSRVETKPPWDVIHYETVDGVPAGTRSVLFKYLWNASEAGPIAASIYAVRMEANARAPAHFAPIDVTFTWDEVQADRSRIERSHTQRVARIPTRYAICVGGADHPIVKSLRVGLAGAIPDLKLGYSDGRDAGGERFIPRWVTYGKNLAEGKPYTVSIPSGDNWGAGDPEGTKLTDGIVGPPYGSGPVARYGLCWTEGKEPVVTVDLGARARAGAFRIQLSGYPDRDALKGEVRDAVEVETSLDGERYESRGAFDLNLRWKDLAANHMWPDDERIMGHNFEKILPEPIDVRYVRFRIRAARFLFVSEVQVLDRIEYRPFDLRISLP
ncbi:MAG: hypothetical protein JXP34_23525, partial [Planctomycetes bacterium]|nr:hypothetical protein [Planctomycetota bacterium]